MMHGSGFREAAEKSMHEAMCGDRPKRKVSYRCPWCEKINNDAAKARYHSISCDKKTDVLWSSIKNLPKRELKKIAKT